MPDTMDSYYYFNGNFVQLKDRKFNFMNHFSSQMKPGWVFRNLELKQPVSGINMGIKKFLEIADKENTLGLARNVTKIKETVADIRKIIKKLVSLNKPNCKNLEPRSAYLSRYCDEFVIGIGYTQKR
ncbi:MAG: hypothetical protein ABII22_02025 [Candidatus Micrarchaeota archaeon]